MLCMGGVLVVGYTHLDGQYIVARLVVSVAR